jgi:hypothetical protein
MKMLVIRLSLKDNESKFINTGIQYLSYLYKCSIYRVTYKSVHMVMATANWRSGQSINTSRTLALDITIYIYCTGRF